MPRTRLCRVLRRAYREAERGVDLLEPQAGVSRARVSRRRFLEIGGFGALALASVPLLSACARFSRITTTPGQARIAIIGAGMAGLSCAYWLSKRGIAAQVLVYEASHRCGGRVFSVSDVLAPGLTTEFGGEFIDSNHADMLQLAREFGLPLLDHRGPTERDFQGELFFFEGQVRREEELVAAFRDISPRLIPDVRLAAELEPPLSPKLLDLDRLSLSEYLNRIDVRGWLRSLIDVAYTAEYGLDLDQQSALNFLLLFKPDQADEIFGESDERFQIAGGNQRLVDAMAKSVEPNLRLLHTLEALRASPTGYVLTFRNENGVVIEHTADVVVIAIPFSTLRKVSLHVEMPVPMRQAVAELNCGTNAKYFLGCSQRVWRDKKYSGMAFSDLATPLVWDSSRGQGGEAGSLTVFLGGRAGREIGTRDPENVTPRYLAALDQYYPGMSTAWNGKDACYDWPSNPYSHGSYVCFRPGQYGAFWGMFNKPLGQLYFAGEHISQDAQGFMNGAAETGRKAAEQIARTAGRVIS